MSFGSPKGTLENTYYHWPLSIVTQSIWIYDHFSVSPIGQSLLLILAHAQYPLKVESPCNIVAWWIMTVVNLASWFTIGLVYCSSHTLTMRHSSQWPRQVIPPIRRWCTTTFIGLSKSMNQLWTTYLLTRNRWLVSSVQLLMHPSHV